MNLFLRKKELPLQYQYTWKNDLVCQALISLGSPALIEGSDLLLPTVYLRISFYYLPFLQKKKERKEKNETFKSTLKFITSVYLLFPPHLILLFVLGKIEFYVTLTPKL